jgi:integrase
VVAQIRFGKREKKLPFVPSVGEVRRLLKAVTNVKHRTALLTIDAAGLRISEALSLVASDVDSEPWTLARISRGLLVKSGPHPCPWREDEIDDVA